MLKKITQEPEESIPVFSGYTFFDWVIICACTVAFVATLALSGFLLGMLDGGIVLLLGADFTWSVESPTVDLFSVSLIRGLIPLVLVTSLYFLVRMGLAFLQPHFRRQRISREKQERLMERHLNKRLGLGHAVVEEIPW